jgi:stage II sporulation protein D
MFTGGTHDKQGPATAARDTEGEVLTYGGEVIETLYHSACGGATEEAKDVWDRDYPYLKSQDCSCGKESPYAKWEKPFTSMEVEKPCRRRLFPHPA